MAIKSTLDLFESPIPATFEDVDDVELEIFFALGIVNPYGPTLTYVAAIGEPKLGVSRQLVSVLLNPFSQDYKQIGRFTIGDDLTPQILDPLYKLTIGDCPSLILLSGNSNEQLRALRSEQILSTFDRKDVDRLCAWIEDYFGNPWDRIRAVMDEKKAPESEQSSVSSLKRLSYINTKTEHVWQELQALFYAWDGSINQAQISESLKRSAFPKDKFKHHFTERLLPSLWVPAPPADSSDPPPVIKPERYVAETVEQLRADLYRENWDDFGLDKLADLLRSAILLYGLQINMQDIPHISRLYQNAIVRGLDSETRLLIETEVFQEFEKRRISCVVFIPFIVEDPDQQVASKAVIDFISESPHVDGELYAIKELRSFFQGGRLTNRAAVFGGIVAIGDIELQPFLREFRGLLSPDEVTQAAKVHTQFLKHRTIQFWLEWCKELVERKDPIDQKKFGASAMALSICLKFDQHKAVHDAKRNFPCTGQAEAITKLRAWTLDEYAERIAPELYELEQLEEAPKLFSDVLRDWGLKPASPLVDQYIPEMDQKGAPLRALRNLAPKVPANDDNLVAWAESGDAVSQYRLANRYYAGDPFPRDLEKARAWYLKAATAGHVISQFNLGCMCAQGEGAPADEEQALLWHHHAAKQWHPDAMNNIGAIYEKQGKLSEAFPWYLQAAFQGSPNAQGSCGFALSNGRGVDANPERAAVFYRLAALNGNAIAQSNLSGLFSVGKGVRQDHKEAFRWSSLSAHQGYSPAQTRLGDLYERGEGVEASMEKAAYWFLKGSLQDNTTAQELLGIQYLTGSAGVKDELIAYMWFSIALKLGSANALKNLKLIQLDTNSEICKLVQSAIEENLDAQSALAFRFQNGDGVLKDEGAFTYWLYKASEGGGAWAQTVRSNVLLEKSDKTQEGESLAWLMIAVRQWYVGAIVQLGFRHLLGYGGCEKNDDEAMKNLIQSSLMGSLEARVSVEKLSQSIRAESWEPILSQIYWPSLVFLLGPLAPGHFDSIRASQENDDGSENPEWLEFDRKVATAIFMSDKGDHAGFLEPIFGQPVKLRNITVERSIVDKKSYSAVKISLRDMQTDDGLPVYWQPERDALKAVEGLIGAMAGRLWIQSKLLFE